MVVGDDEVGQGHVAGVGHRVGEDQSAAGDHMRPGRGVGVLAVDGLDDPDAGMNPARTPGIGAAKTSIHGIL